MFKARLFLQGEGGGGKISIGFAYRNRPLNSIFTTAKLRI